MIKYIKNGMLIVGTTLILAAGTASTAHGAQHDDGELYRASELSFDLFGTASLAKYSVDHLSGSRIRHDATLGAGAGLSYFVTRNIGFGGEAYSENTRRSLVDSASGNLLLRFPLGQTGFAPYALGGTGYQFDSAKAWFVQAGGGIEYRFTPQVGTFFDARLVVPDKTKYYGVARLGLRFAF